MTDSVLADIARRCTIQTMERLPKYLRLMNAVEDALSEGLLKPGDRLPTETELTQAVPYALGTVQKALGGLVSRGVLSRSRRSGTFVAEPARPLDDMSRFAFERPDGTRVGQVLTRVAECAAVAGDPRLAAVLGADANGYVRIVRIDEVDGAFACCSETHLRGSRFPQLLHEPLDALSGHNLRPLLARRYDAATARLDFATRATPFPARISALLEVAPGTTGLELEITARAADGAALFVQTLHIPPTGYRLRFIAPN